MKPIVEMPSGKFFDLVNPTADMVDIYDIAWNLTRIPRFNGGTIGNKTYTVAEHSIWVAKYLERRFDNPLLALHGLLHDAHEAYTGDITSPMKAIDARLHTAITLVQRNIQTVIQQKLGVHRAHIYWRDFIHCADQQALAKEAYELMPSKGAGEHWNALPAIDPFAAQLPLQHTYVAEPDYFPFLLHFNYLTTMIDLTGKENLLP
jgi:hypothetical protein